MKKVKVESPLSKRLTALREEVVLYDADGYALGFFRPMRERRKIDEMGVESMLTVDELAKRRKVRTGKPLEDILRKHGL